MECARLLHELPVAADDVHAAIDEVGRVEPVAGCRETLVDGAPLGAVEARHRLSPVPGGQPSIVPDSVAKMNFAGTIVVPF